MIRRFEKPHSGLLVLAVLAALAVSGVSAVTTHGWGAASFGGQIRITTQQDHSVRVAPNGTRATTPALPRDGVGPTSDGTQAAGGSETVRPAGSGVRRFADEGSGIVSSTQSQSVPSCNKPCPPRTQ